MTVKTKTRPIKKVIVYDEKNISNYFLSPYANFNFSKDKVYFEQWLFSKNISIYCDTNKMENFIEALSEGLSEEEIIFHLNDMFGKNAQSVMINLIKNGVIE
jgi:hypothetical protein